jgi:Uncharacterized protein conserved in bacteria
MVKKEVYEQRVEEYLLPILEEYGFELIDVEYVKEVGNMYLRVYLDKENGIAIEDCELVSRKLGDWLDDKDFIDDSYILEVSSPGLGRALRKDKDLERSIGLEVDLKLYKAIDKCKEFCGILTAYDTNSITLKADEDIEVKFERSNIAIIKLALDF